MAPCEYHEKLLESLNNDSVTPDMQAHLKHCSECRVEQERYSRLVESLIHQKVDVFMRNAEETNELPHSGLPDHVMKLVNERKKQWLKGQLKKVLGCQGLTDKNEQQKRLDQLMKEPAPDLPLAAFPDDLNNDDES